VPTALQDAVEDGFREIRIVQDSAPRGERFIRREDHGALMQVAVVHDLEEHIGGIRPIAEISHLVDHQHMGMRVGREEVAEAARAGGERQFADERRRGREGCVEAILDGSVGDGDGEVRLAGAARPAQDEGVPRGDDLPRAAVN
jgi:hypothetical protein